MYSEKIEKITEYIDGVLARDDQRKDKVCFVLSHGAGNNMDHPLIEKVFNFLCQAKLPVLKFNFSYIKRGIDPKDLEWSDGDKDMESVIGYLKTKHYKQFILIGKSMGGILSLRFASKHKNIKEVYILGYPMRFAGRENNVLLQELGERVVVINGDKDETCDIKLLRKYSKNLFKLHIIKGDSHSFKNFISGKEDFDKVMNILREYLPERQRF